MQVSGQVYAKLSASCPGGQQSMSQQSLVLWATSLQEASLQVEDRIQDENQNNARLWIALLGFSGRS